MTDLKKRLDRLSEVATPGPWYVTEQPWFNSADGIVAGSPDGNICAPVADFEQCGAGHEYHFQGSTFSLGDKYDARADTQFVVDVVNAYRSGDLIVNGATLQQRVAPWMDACFGPEISADKMERNHRFLEEALELVQSTGCTKAEATQLVDYVYGRNVGDPPQEVGGVMITLAALCLAHSMDMHECGEIELARIWTKVEQIRAKQAAKPKNSPLPQHVEDTFTREEMEKAVLAEREACAAVCDRWDILWSKSAAAHIRDRSRTEETGE